MPNSTLRDVPEMSVREKKRRVASRNASARMRPAYCASCQRVVPRSMASMASLTTIGGSMTTAEALTMRMKPRR